MSYVIEGKTGPWEIVVGLEVHAQVISQSKLFSGASTKFGVTRTHRSALLMRPSPVCCLLSTRNAWRRPSAPGWG
ncbi:Asparaginyl-tRNA synthase (glutamine-hydrolyzing) [Acetobacter pasteurianus subsp. pasteurianus]|uniref:Asparaginyl-tRNA synthase (Glutamine-hydrolyzing) n=1 Tax=Acetobacter pasteurianus subsp. pasteurianus TaxID=481145 RepID=A0AAC9SR72_ACEPA|nr:Asparaginyl-tRNA synthase (glutamine-hydrolyzing) [Acetobacter pasteurianus subsp. pasteurianus]